MKKLVTAIIMPFFTFVSTAQADDIFTILERNAAIERAAPPDNFDYSYIAEFIFEQKQGKESEIFEARYRVDPNAPAGERVIIESSSAPEWHASFKAYIENLDSEDYTISDAAEDLWCGTSNSDEGDESGFGNLLQYKDDITIISENDEEAVLEMPFEVVSDNAQFSVNLGDDASEDDNAEGNKVARKLFKRMQMQMTLDKPEGHMRDMRIWLPKPMRLKLIAKIKQMEITTGCAPAPNGELYKTHQSVETTASALGQQVYSQQVTRILELK